MLGSVSGSVHNVAKPSERVETAPADEWQTGKAAHMDGNNIHEGVYPNSHVKNQQGGHPLVFMFGTVLC